VHQRSVPPHIETKGLNFKLQDMIILVIDKHANWTSESGRREWPYALLQVAACISGITRVAFKSLETETRP
jgi:hypothetical protein